jgi:DNA polymerase-3 subunit delta'
LFDGIIGQELAQRYLRGAVAGGRLAHAYLFYGPAGVGKKTMARMLTQTLVCADRTDGYCGRCPPCRMFSAGTHPDLLVLDGFDAAIGIAQVRQLQRGLGYQPYGRRHLCLLQDAESLTIEAANALLKTLEEPLEPTLFILTSSRPDHLPSTVVSRCLKIPFRPLTKDEIIFGLEKMGFSGELLLVTAGLSEGSLGRAVELAAGRGVSDWRRQVAALAGELLSGIGMAELFVRARELGERTELLARTELLLLWYRDLLLWRETGSRKYIVNVDRLDQIRIQAGHVTTPMLVRGINAIEDIRRKLLANANVRLAAEVLCLRLAGLVKEDVDFQPLLLTAE